MDTRSMFIRQSQSDKARRYQRAKQLADRVMRLAAQAEQLVDEEDADQVLTNLDRYVLKVEGLINGLQYPDTGSEYPELKTLKSYRKKLKLSQSKLVLLVNVYAMLAEDDASLAEITAQIRRLYNGNYGQRIDTNYISKFEKGSSLPWYRAIVLLTEVLNILDEEDELTPKTLFPEIDFDQVPRFHNVGVKNRVTYSRSTIKALQQEFTHLAPKPQSEPKRKSKRSRRRPTCGLFDDDPIVITPEQIDVLHEIARELV